jgi:hypothetical protein
MLKLRCMARVLTDDTHQASSIPPALLAAAGRLPVPEPADETVTLAVLDLDEPATEAEEPTPEPLARSGSRRGRKESGGPASHRRSRFEPRPFGDSPLARRLQLLVGLVSAAGLVYAGVLLAGVFNEARDQSLTNPGYRPNHDKQVSSVAPGVDGGTSAGGPLSPAASEGPLDSPSATPPSASAPAQEPGTPTTAPSAGPSESQPADGGGEDDTGTGTGTGTGDDPEPTPSESSSTHDPLIDVNIGGIGIHLL